MKESVVLKQNKPRDMNFELLRIISMIMVVALHYMLFSGMLKDNIVGGANWIFSWTIEALSIVSVNCYILISGYFLVKSQFKLKKLMQLWFQILFYSIGVYIVFVGIDLINFNIKDLVKYCLPVLLNRYWFATVYIAMYILSPFLNIAVHAMKKEQLRNLLIILFVMLSVWSTILPFGKSLDNSGGYSIIHFIFLYFVASYIRLYWTSNIERWYFIGIYFLITLLVIISKVFLVSIGLSGLSNVFYAYNSVTIVLSSISLFLFFKSITIKNNTINKIIGSISGLTFGVFLIHTHSLISSMLYKNLLHVDSFVNTKIFMPIAIGSILEIFIICTIIDAIRNRVFFIINNSNIINKAKEKIMGFLMKLASNIYTKLSRNNSVST